jgi:G3E family GTPase
LKWTSEAGPAALFGGTDAPFFGRRHRRPRGPRLPVVAVTGFLGAGKTTLIRELLNKPEGANTAVVVNEYGEIGIDHALLRASSDVTVLLGNGCLCCNVRTDLQETLRGLFADRARGAVPSFARVVIETSGLADPGPVLQTFATDRALGREFHLQALVTVIDAVDGESNLARMPEARKQVALADRIVVTKSDLADAATTGRLIGHIGTLNPVPLATAAGGEIEPSFVLDEPPSSRRNFNLGEAEHTHGLRSFSLIFEKRLSWPSFEQAMAVLTALRGPDLLRVKGVLAVEECRGPVVVHFVQHVAHPPVELEDWPDGDRRSRLVFVTRGLAREPVAQFLPRSQRSPHRARPSAIAAVKRGSSRSRSLAIGVPTARPLFTIHFKSIKSPKRFTCDSADPSAGGLYASRSIDLRGLSNRLNYHDLSFWHALCC